MYTFCIHTIWIVHQYFLTFWETLRTSSYRNSQQDIVSRFIQVSKRKSSFFNSYKKLLVWASFFCRPFFAAVTRHFSHEKRTQNAGKGDRQSRWSLRSKQKVLHFYHFTAKQVICTQSGNICINVCVCVCVCVCGVHSCQICFVPRCPDCLVWLGWTRLIPN